MLVARQAAAVAREGWRKHPSVAEKGVADLVTPYDLASERLIREKLAELTPSLGIVGEEGGGDPGAGAAWYCDPIDGTTNFAHGHPFWAVSLGVVEHGEPVVGVVVAPCLGVEWVAWHGGVATRNGEECRVSTTHRLADALIGTGFPRGPTQAFENNFPAFERVKPVSRGVRRCGSAAIDLCFVADGTYDAYWERLLGIWDSAAGVAIVRAAGGTVTHLNGGPADLARGHLLASNGRIHEPLCQLVRDSAGNVA